MHLTLENRIAARRKLWGGGKGREQVGEHGAPAAARSSACCCCSAGVGWVSQLLRAFEIRSWDFAGRSPRAGPGCVWWQGNHSGEGGGDGPGELFPVRLSIRPFIHPQRLSAKRLR